MHQKKSESRTKIIKNKKKNPFKDKISSDEEKIDSKKIDLKKFKKDKLGKWFKKK